MRHLLVVIAIVVGVGQAQAEDTDEAKRLFEEGRKLVEEGNTVEACKRFAQSLVLERAPGTLLNLGDCAESEGTPRKAWQLFDEAARELERTDQAERARFARNRADAVLKNYPGVAAQLRAEREADEAKQKAKQATEREPAVAQETGSPTYTKLKVAIITAYGLSAIGAAVWAQAYFGPMKTLKNSDQTIPIFEDADGDGEYLEVQGSVLTHDECARDDIRSYRSEGSRNGVFDDSCRAYARTRWAIPLTVVGSLVGTAAAIYLMTRPEEPSPRIAVTPSVSSEVVGAVLTGAW